MTISDLLTLIGILTAVVVAISEKSREYLILKFSSIEIYSIVILFFYVHFLLSYQWWLEKFDFLTCCQIEGYPSPNAWAYIISISVLFYLIWKVFNGQFPRLRKNKVLSYYNKLLLRNDTAFLAQLIEKYHLIQVVKYLREEKGNNKQAKLYSRIQKRDYEYGKLIYNHIIQNDTFINKVANINPYLFLNLIQELNVEKLKNVGFVNDFLYVLMNNKNNALFREIRSSFDLDLNKLNNIDSGSIILNSLFRDINVSVINQAWGGIAESAINEMIEEANKKYSPLRNKKTEVKGDIIWSYRITAAIWYFHLMLQEAIRSNVESHMNMYYYKDFVSLLLANMYDLPFDQSNLNEPSRNFDLISDIISNMINWKNLIIQTHNNKLSLDIYKCIGECVFEIASTDKLNEYNKDKLIRCVWEDLMLTSGKDEKGIVIEEELMEYGFEAFKNPSPLFRTEPMFITDGSRRYVSAINILLENKDFYKDIEKLYPNRVERFNTEVVEFLTSKLEN